MDRIKITEDNLETYRALIPEDVAENIGREYYRGVALGEGDPEAALIWEIKNADEEDKETTSEVVWAYRRSADEGGDLFAAYSKEAGYEEVVRTWFELPGEDRELQDFFEDAGFSTKLREGRDVIVSVGDLSELSIARGKVPSYVMGLGELMVRQYRRGIMDCLIHRGKGIHEDLAQLPMGFFDQEISSCVMMDDKVDGFLLVHVLPSGAILISFLCSLGPDSRINMAMMMRRSIQMAAKQYPANTRVILRRHDEASEKLAAKLFPKKKGETVLGGERMEG